DLAVVLMTVFTLVFESSFTPDFTSLLVSSLDSVFVSEFDFELVSSFTLSLSEESEESEDFMPFFPEASVFVKVLFTIRGGVVTFAVETPEILGVETSDAFAVCATQKAQAAVAILIIVVDNTSTVLLFIFPSYKINKFKKLIK
ncbi:MAG: hypothetical protein N4R59_06230, partial [Lactobacillus iners]|nr:hypothetical protein [Lactobacillus iners]